MNGMDRYWLVFLVAVAIVFAVLELSGWLRMGTPGTLSAHVRYWSNLHPIVPFLTGCLIGGLAIHFWAVA